ncbi:CS domain-containing protein [Chloropicon primus]|uniref:CS domain-containing protein n=1 Tax=Chloropicon primus TaxID=1764295 RepID=A0A5B8MJ69_9CHLO|nr:CS domain-containing protein [Chloropicon primus]UPQ98601.1 CS domain-containing protein [Chloropicon primus]|eukprot:QDZ19392.1 CS domain-containing protein [Chloropicon primus]
MEEEGRYRVEGVEGGHGGYEWSQNVEEVNVVVRCSTGLNAKRNVKCVIRPNRVKLEATSCSRVDKEEFETLFDHELVGQVKPDESFWTLDSKSGLISLTLQKFKEGESWSGVFQGHEAISVQDRESEQKRLLLERFQLEHPGFDFSGAEVNGVVPDASTFMGGINKS